MAPILARTGFQHARLLREPGELRQDARGERAGSILLGPTRRCRGSHAGAPRVPLAVGQSQGPNETAPGTQRFPHHGRPDVRQPQLRGPEQGECPVGGHGAPTEVEESLAALAFDERVGCTYSVAGTPGIG